MRVAIKSSLVGCGFFTCCLSLFGFWVLPLPAVTPGAVVAGLLAPPLPPRTGTGAARPLPLPLTAAGLGAPPPLDTGVCLLVGTPLLTGIQSGCYDSDNTDNIRRHQQQQPCVNKSKVCGYGMDLVTVWIWLQLLRHLGLVN